ncbi:hypothetical protein WJX73_009680 [Symbiochloris irregularis]|uniref:Uncharacterized protein n=1 Tax=Symbiochloris irregularis TaxID=706552 RepID=A0AAW1NTN4_9CHLO
MHGGLRRLDNAAMNQLVEMEVCSDSGKNKLCSTVSTICAVLKNDRFAPCLKASFDKVQKGALVRAEPSSNESRVFAASLPQELPSDAPVLDASFQRLDTTQPHLFQDAVLQKHLHDLRECFDLACFSIYYKRLMGKWGGPEEGPHFLRHVFVVESMSFQAVPGPGESGAAGVMGNSFKVWLSHYCKGHGLPNLEMQKWVDHMTEWRQTLLAEV